MPLGSTGDEEMYFSSSLPSQEGSACFSTPWEEKGEGYGRQNKYLS